MFNALLTPLRWLRAQWRADALLVIVALASAVAGAWILVQPAYPWGIGQ